MITKLRTNVAGLLCLLATLTGMEMLGQLTLPAGTSYTQNFDAIGSGLPTGWTVRSGATATGRGTSETLTTTTTDWANASGSFKNYASADGLTSSASATVQNASSDRALGLRQTGSFANPGAAFELQLANTTNRTNFSLQLKHQMLSFQPRSTVWTVQYSTSATGASWSNIGTYSDPGAFGSTTVDLNLGTALDNISGTVFIRVVALTASTGSGNNDTYGIDDVVLSWTNGSSPAATLSGTLNEASLNGTSFTVALTNDTFASTTLSAASYTLTNAPTGVSILSVTYVNSTTATVVLSYDNTDFDTTVTNANVTIAANQLTSNAQLVSGNINITAVTETLTSAGTLAFGSVCINTTSDSSFTLTGTVKAGTVSLTAATGYTFSLTSGSNYTSTLSFPVSAGSLNQIIYVRFAPVAAVSYGTGPTISGGSASSIVKAFSGTGVNTTATVTTPTSASVTSSSATLGGNLTAAGCGTITERGIYYSTTNGFANGAGTKVSETGTFSTGVFTIPVTGLLPNTTYYYKAFAVNNGGEGYSSQGTFSTPAVAVTVPYTQDFEASNITDFTFVAYTGTTNAWRIGSGTNNGGTKAMYISNNSGTANTYTITSTTQTGAKLLVDLIGVTSATLSFDWKALGETVNSTVYDFGEVYITSNGVETLLSEEFEFRNSTAFATKTLNLSPYVGGVVEIEFYWENDNGGGSNPPFAIDNISIVSGSTPVVTTSAASGIASVAATLGGNVTNDGGSTVTARGVVYGTSQNPTLSNNVAAMGSGTGVYQSSVTGLSDFTTYYARAYATNSMGTTYGSQVQFTTSILEAPVAQEETPLSTGGTGFIANWDAVAGASSYSLDVSTSSTFGTVTPTTVTEGFLNGSSTAGYTFTSITTYTSTGNFGVALPGLQFNDTADRVVSPVLSGAATQMSFWLKGNGTGVSSSYLTVEGYNGSQWVTIQTINNISETATTITYSAATTPALPANITQFRFTYNKTTGNIAFDDLSIDYGATTLNVLPGYNGLTVNGTEQAVTGLSEGATYYYRVRAVSANSTSANSNTITAIALASNIWNGTAWSSGEPTSAQTAIIEGDYNTGTLGIFSANNLIINSNVFTVAEGTTLTIQNAIINNAAAENFIVENGAAVIQANDVDNTGDVTVDKDSNVLYKLDYTIWSSPVMGQTLGDFSPLTHPSRFYTYGVVNGEEDYISMPTSTIFQEGIGYLIRMPNHLEPTDPNYQAYEDGDYSFSLQGRFQGTLNNGTVQVPLSTEINNVTMVGNPYPSPISVVEFFDDNTGVLMPGQGIYFWRKRNNQAATSFASLTKTMYTANDGGGVESGEEYTAGGQIWEDYFSSTPATWVIAPAQGFYVVGNGSAGNLTFTNSMREPIAAGQPFFRMNNNNNNDQPALSRLWLNLYSETNFSQTGIAYTELGTLGLDYGMDAKNFNSEAALNMYTVMGEDNLTIQTRPAFNAEDVVALGYNVAEAGTYQIALHRKDGIFENGQNVYLRDNLIDMVHDFTEGQYSFTTEAGTFNNRFEVIYSNEVLGNNNPAAALNSVVVYNKNEQLNVHAGKLDINALVVYDIRGRVLYNKENINQAEAVIAMQPQQQVLLVEITTPQGKVTRKVVY